jgi:hypothetical protein
MIQDVPNHSWDIAVVMQWTVLFNKKINEWQFSSLINSEVISSAVLAARMRGILNAYTIFVGKPDRLILDWRTILKRIFQKKGGRV